MAGRVDDAWARECVADECVADDAAWIIVPTPLAQSLHIIEMALLEHRKLI